MKSLCNYITEKILINKNTKFYRPKELDRTFSCLSEFVDKVIPQYLNSSEYYTYQNSWDDKQNKIMVDDFYESKGVKRGEYSYTIKFTSQYISEPKPQLVMQVIDENLSFNKIYGIKHDMFWGETNFLDWINKYGDPHLNRIFLEKTN